MTPQFLDALIKSQKNSEMTSRFYEEEDVFAKIQELERVEARTPYAHASKGATFWDRVENAVRTLPTLSQQDAARTLFSATIYLNKDILDAAFSLIVNEAGELCRTMDIKPGEETHIFCVDHQDMVERLYDIGSQWGWNSRQSNPTLKHIRTCSQLLTSIKSLLDDKTHSTDASTEALKEVLHKQIWFVVTDNALGGGSARSDIRRLKTILDICGLKDTIDIYFLCESYLR